MDGLEWDSDSKSRFRDFEQLSSETMDGLEWDSDELTNWLVSHQNRLKRWTAWSGIQTYPQVALIHNPLYKKPPSLWITFAVAIQVALERARQQNLMPMGIKNMPVAMRVAPEQARQPCGFKYATRCVFARSAQHPRCSRTAVRPPHARAG